VLLENAVSLSPPAEPVEVALDRRDGELQVTVLDRGPGIPDELRERIFGAFTQADASTTRTHEGLGIGLYLARRIMSAHGGGIDFERREGGGAMFRLSFPALDERVA
jgi:signal transduction histidine kinase